ncbi:hypothetical protein [Niabella aquatica]
MKKIIVPLLLLLSHPKIYCKTNIKKFQNVINETFSLRYFIRLTNCFWIGIILLTNACSKAKTDEPSIPHAIISEQEGIAKEYGIKTDEIANLTLGGFSDDTTKILFYGSKEGKLWINIGDKKIKKSILNWVDSKLLDTLLIENLGYGEVRKTVLNKTLIYPVYNSGNISFTLIRANENSIGIKQNRYFFKNSTYLKKIEADYKNVRDGFHPIIWFNGSVLYNDGYSVNINDVNYNKNQYTIYDIDGNPIAKLYENGRSRFKGDNFYLVDYDQAIYLDDPYFIKWDYKVEKELWRTEKAIAGQISTNLRIDSKKISRNGEILTVNCNYTSYGGEKGTFSYTVNITSGQVTKI